MIEHGSCCAGEMLSALATPLRSRGWRVETPTIHPQLRWCKAPQANLVRLAVADDVAETAAAARRIPSESVRWSIGFGHSVRRGDCTEAGRLRLRARRGRVRVNRRQHFPMARHLR